MLLVTGMSGAGKTVALKALEDAGFEAVDNPPLSLLPALLADESVERAPLVVGIDVRTRDFSVERLSALMDDMRAGARVLVRLLFLDCDDEVVLRRYTETRRRHPLAIRVTPREGVRAERAMLAPVRDGADRVIDTSIMTPYELRRMVQAEFGIEDPGGTAVFVTSFSFKRGLPREADLVFDVRFLTNPHYVGSLRSMSGLDEPVREYVAEDPGFGPFVSRLQALLEYVLPRYEREGKSYLTIAFGCTGGRHRSVFLAELVGRWLINEGWQVSTAHRDLSASIEEAVPRSSS